MGTLKAALKFVAIAVVGLVLAGVAAVTRRSHGAGKEVSHQAWPEVPRRPSN